PSTLCKDRSRPARPPPNLVPRLRGSPFLPRSPLGQPHVPAFQVRYSAHHTRRRGRKARHPRSALAALQRQSPAFGSVHRRAVTPGAGGAATPNLSITKIVIALTSCPSIGGCRSSPDYRSSRDAYLTRPRLR